MRRSLSLIGAMMLLAAGMALTSSGCKKKPVTPPPPPPPPPVAEAPKPAPTISLTASPSSITSGQSATLSWSAQNATSVSIDGGVGSVGTSGDRTVSPATSTTYTATATGPGGSTSASARVTVEEPPPAPAPPPAISDSEFFRTRVADVFFDYDKYDIRDDARGVLNDNARALGERTGIRFTIEGHCDERGSEKYNLALGDRRANAAKQYLVGQGVSADRMDTVSLGEERPFESGHSEESWAKNRRAHFVMK